MKKLHTKLENMFWKRTEESVRGEANTTAQCQGLAFLPLSSAALSI